MQIPKLGNVTRGERFGWLYSDPLQLSVFSGKESRIVLEDYDEDESKEDFHFAIGKFLTIGPNVLAAAEPYIFQYYRDMNSNWSPFDEEFLSINSPSDVWSHIQLGSEAMVSRRAYGDKSIYVSIECNCDWEPEHGLQIVFKDGSVVCKVGPYDGHLTNSDAFADKGLENVIYRGI